MADDPRTIPALIKHVGRGARLAKALTRDDARWMMTRLARGDATPEQQGAFLIALRMKGETAEELAGFADALAEGAADALGGPLAPGRPVIDVDLHGDGRAGRPIATLPAACVAAALGAGVLVRAAADNPHARAELGAILDFLGLTTTPAAARRTLDGVGFAVVDLAGYAPAAARLLGLRALLGVRSAVNTAVKLMDPLGTRRVVVGIFHGPYHAPVAGAVALRGVARAAIVQAPGGVPELAPDKPTRVSLIDDGVPAGVRELHGGTAPLVELGLGPLPTCADAVAHASAIQEVLARPASAPRSLVRFVLATASLHLWAAGLAPTPLDPETLARAHEVLHTGQAAAVLAAAR